MFSALLIFQLATTSPPAESAAAAAPARPTFVMAPAPRPSVRPGFEATGQLTLGGGASFASTRAPMALFTLGARGDVLFARNSIWAWGVGPYLSVRTNNFQDVSVSLGASLLVPVNDVMPLMFSGGGVLRFDNEGTTPGGMARAWWGFRSFNYHSAYVLSAGIFVEGRYFAGGSADVMVGLDADLQALVIPWMLLYTWLSRSDPAR